MKHVIQKYFQDHFEDGLTDRSYLQNEAGYRLQEHYQSNYNACGHCIFDGLIHNFDPEKLNLKFLCSFEILEDIAS